MLLKNTAQSGGVFLLTFLCGLFYVAFYVADVFA